MRQPALGIARWSLIATSLLITIYPSATVVTAAAAVIQLEPIVTGWTSPIYLTSARDGTDRRFIVEQGGVIKVLQPGATTQDAQRVRLVRAESGQLDHDHLGRLSHHRA